MPTVKQKSIVEIMEVRFEATPAEGRFLETDV